MTLLLTSDEGHHNYGIPHQMSAEEIIVIVNVAYISNLNVNEKGLRNFALSS